MLRVSSVFVPSDRKKLRGRILLAGLTILASSSLILSGCGGSSKQTTPTPTISPAAGSYTTAQTVTVTDSNANAALFCTTDGSVPTTSSPQCTAPITVSKSETINAIAQVPGFNPSSVATAAYTINTLTAATPVISPNGGTFTSAQTVTLTDATAGAAIYYTTNGTTPTTSSTQYITGTPITVSTTETINAIAVATGYNNSALATAAFTINLPSTATPTFSPVAGAVVSGTTVAISDATPGATIYYTTDGTTPTASSTQYNSSTPISVTQAETIEAIAIASGDSVSGVASAAYTIQALPSITGTVASGTLPVNGASVQLYAAGTSGYGAGATAVGSPVTTAANGSFKVTYTCPAAPGDQMYLVATGGTTSTTPSAPSNTRTSPPACPQPSPSTRSPPSPRRMLYRPSLR
jgi:AraC-like DNA-binding protein